MIRSVGFITVSLAAANVAAGAEILLNQIGYYPEKPKVVFVADSDEQGYELFSTENDEPVALGGLGEAVAYPEGGITARTIEFTSRVNPGDYFIRLQDGTESSIFRIGTNVYDEARAASLKAFYFNRATQEITAEFGGDWARPLGHPDDNVRYHSSTGHADGFAASPKGWYDAGDYGKYVVNGGYALGSLLSLHELLPNSTGDDTGIPESGNHISDLLDEARWELEWFLTMQDADGGVFHKLTTLNFAGFVMPHQTTAQRYFIGKSVTATLNFAACLAQAARVFGEIDPEFASNCLEAAKRAWTWAKANPDATYSQPSDVHTGAYGDASPADEFEWAAAQLFLTTGETSYEDELSNLYVFGRLDESAGWPNTRNLAVYSLATVENDVTVSFQQQMRSLILFKAQEVLAQIEENPLRSPLRATEFYWGSNGVAAGKGVLLAYAYHISGDDRYAEGMVDVADYLLGRNATEYSFLTGFGSKSPRHIHHRPSGADEVAEPIPGFLAGGPNNGREDGAPYPHPTSQPARSYVDLQESYASNEIAINWNAPLLFLLSALEDSQPSTFHPQADHIYMSPAEQAYGAVLANDSSNPGAQLTAELVSRPRLGNFDFEEDGTVSLYGDDLPYGNLYFQYRASDGDQISDPILVTLSIVPSGFDRNGPPPTAYEAWLFNYPELAGDDALPGADPDADGLANIWESLFLGDPTLPDCCPEGGLRMLPPTAEHPFRILLRAPADYALSDTRIELLVRSSLHSEAWLHAGDDAYPVFQTTITNLDLETGLADFLFESGAPYSEALFLTLESARAD